MMNQNRPVYPSDPLGFSEADRLHTGVSYPAVQTIQLPNGPFRGSYVADHAWHAAADRRSRSPPRLLHGKSSAQITGRDGPSQCVAGHRPLTPTPIHNGPNGPSRDSNGFGPLSYPLSNPNGYDPLSNPAATPLTVMYRCPTPNPLPLTVTDRTPQLRL